ncbi:hypothetical protein AVEN_232985-1, partial [Araneus ventricosus]
KLPASCSELHCSCHWSPAVDQILTKKRAVQRTMKRKAKSVSRAIRPTTGCRRNFCPKVSCLRSRQSE